MVYDNFTIWLEDVHYYFPDHAVNTNVDEYWVDVSNATVAYWRREDHVGFINIKDSTI